MSNLKLKKLLTIITAFAVPAIFVLSFVSCEMTDDNSDEYYKKSEVNNLFYNATEFMFDNNGGWTITDDGFINGASITLPDYNVKGVFIEIEISNTSGDQKIFALSLTSTNTAGMGGAYIITLPDGAYSKNRVYYPVFSTTPGSTMVLWQDTGQALATSDFTGVSINVDVIQWIRNS